MSRATRLLPDELWHEIQPLLPPRPAPSPKGGRPPVDDRDALRGILFVLRSGISWQMHPLVYFLAGAWIQVSLQHLHQNIRKPISILYQFILKILHIRKKNSRI